MPATGADTTGVVENPSTEAPQVSTVLQVPVNIFTGTLKGILGFNSTQVQVLVVDRYDSQETVLYWKFIDIKEWCHIKAKVPASQDGVYYGYSKVKCLQALDLWVTDLTLRGKITDINNFKTDIISDAIEEQRLYFEDKRYGKGDLRKTKELSHEKWTQWEYIIYNYFASRKKCRGVPLY